MRGIARRAGRVESMEDREPGGKGYRYLGDPDHHPARRIASRRISKRCRKAYELTIYMRGIRDEKV